MQKIQRVILGIIICGISTVMPACNKLIDSLDVGPSTSKSITDSIKKGIEGVEASQVDWSSVLTDVDYYPGTSNLLSGTLQEDITVKIDNQDYTFAAEEMMEFHEGDTIKVKSGSLSSPAVVTVGDNEYAFSSGKRVNFHDNEKLKSGTLLSNTKATFNEKEYLFTNERDIVFDREGSVEYGLLASNIIFTNKKRQEYPLSSVGFDREGKVNQGRLAEAMEVNTQRYDAQTYLYFQPNGVVGIGDAPVSPREEVSSMPSGPDNPPKKPPLVVTEDEPQVPTRPKKPPISPPVKEDPTKPGVSIPPVTTTPNPPQKVSPPPRRNHPIPVSQDSPKK